MPQEQSLFDEDLTFHSPDEYQGFMDHTDYPDDKDDEPFYHHYHFSPEGGMLIVPPDLGIILQGPLEERSFEEIQNITSSIKETQYSPYSALFRQRIQNLPKHMVGEDLEETIRFLHYAPLITATHTLGQILSDRSQTISNQRRDSIQRLLEKYRQASTEGTTAHTVLNPAYEHLDVELFDPESQTADDLDEMLGKAHACTYSKVKEKRGPISPAHLYYEDAKRGGSIHYLVKSNPTSVFSIDLNNQQRIEHDGYIYTRLYLAVDSDDIPFLFMDCVEAGDVTWQGVEDYIENDYHDGLLGAMATALTIASDIGIDRVATGDDEATSFAKMLGQTEKRFFQLYTTNTKQKVGLIGSDNYTKGTYLWRMNSSDSFYTFATPHYRPAIFDEIEGHCHQIQERITTKPKSLHTMKHDLKTLQTLLTELEPLAMQYDHSYSRYQFDQMYTRQN